MPITIYPGSMKKRNANGSYSDLVPAIATDPEVLDDFAEEYSTSETYNIGDYCIHNSDLYKCNTNNTTGTWNSNAWDRVSVADELVDHKNTLNQLDTEVDKVENGLAIPQTGDYATRPIPAGAFIWLTGNSNLSDGFYQNTSGSAIGIGALFTISNMTRCYQETGALNTLYNALASMEVRTATYTNITVPANGVFTANLVTLINSDLPSGYKFLGVVGYAVGYAQCSVTSLSYADNPYSIVIKDYSGSDQVINVDINYLAIKL